MKELGLIQTPLVGTDNAFKRELVHFAREKRVRTIGPVLQKKKNKTGC